MSTDKKSSADGQSPQRPTSNLDRLAERYVKLALSLGQHDRDYVDAYFGPSAWPEQVRAEPRSLAAIRDLAETVGTELESLRPTERDDERRRRNLIRQVRSLASRAAMLDGATLSF